MRKLLPASVFVLMMASLGHAASIDDITSNETERSIRRISCDTCKVPEKRKAETPAIELEPGTQRVEVREVNGELKIFRTEAWLGGSPVTYVSKATPQMVSEKAAEADTLASPAGEPVQSLIDKDATTSAVSADTGGAPVETSSAPKASFDAGSLKLRLN